MCGPPTQEKCFPLAPLAAGTAWLTEETVYGLCRHPGASARMMLKNRGRKSFCEVSAGVSVMSGTRCFPENDPVVQPCREHLAGHASRASFSIESSQAIVQRTSLSPREGSITCWRPHNQLAAELG